MRTCAATGIEVANMSADSNSLRQIAAFMMPPGCSGRVTRGHGTRDSGFGTRDSGLGIRDSGFGIRDSGLGVRDSGLGIRDSGKQDCRLRTEDRGLETKD